ncbi:MAG: DUF5103 domain-containing protein [Bacteroidetes bacterium]|nr:MAG: DUF5103 domain-containing protein [Bacteroidota bacterium]TAE62836.1 MAG: DUF5103 domain-containing protein [Bacteroidota bacterium]TAF93024.1 MAG: DUF5103 domain-containing protein [Bacteroidota bacterium]
MKTIICCLYISLCSVLVMAQDRYAGFIASNTVRTTQLFPVNNQTAYPIITLGETQALELHFDDIDRTYKNYFYCFELMDANWQPAQLSTFDYIQGFQQNRITQYRASSIAKTPYFHYQATLPERNMTITKSGNYVVKVFLNGDTSQVAFTKKFLVVEPIANIWAQVKQPFSPDKFRTHQKVELRVDKLSLNIINPMQQLNLTILQNYRWDNALRNIQPTFIRGSSMEFNAEMDCLFPAGKEYRWLDLRSFRFQSERMASVNMNTIPFEVSAKPDAERQGQRYLFWIDRNGFEEITTTDNVNPWWQGDYADVLFTYVPKGNIPLPGKDVYLAAQFTAYQYNENSKLAYNPTKGVYEGHFFLKQGYYTYQFATKDQQTKQVSVQDTEGNYWETENDYTVLLYFRDIAGRYDRLVAATTVNSRNSRIGF